MQTFVPRRKTDFLLLWAKQNPLTESTLCKRVLFCVSLKAIRSPQKRLLLAKKFVDKKKQAATLFAHMCAPVPQNSTNLAEYGDEKELTQDRKMLG